jgi:hypothetical protein
MEREEKQQTSLPLSINHRHKWPDIYCRGSFVAARELAVETASSEAQCLLGDVNIGHKTNVAQHNL